MIYFAVLIAAKTSVQWVFTSTFGHVCTSIDPLLSRQAGRGKIPIRNG
jgi:hypothetical protein